MQSEVSLHSLLVTHTCHHSKGEHLTPLTPSALFSQQIRKLRRELESSQEKVATLTSQLSANVSPHGSHCPLQDTLLCLCSAWGWCWPAPTRALIFPSPVS